MNALQCIIAVNKDIGSYFLTLIKDIPALFTRDYYSRNSEVLIAVAALVAFCVSCIAVMVGSFFAANYFFPDNSAVETWAPVFSIWGWYIVLVYCYALHKKCRANKHENV